MSERFDPAAHVYGPPRFLEDFSVGERFHIPSRTLSDAHFVAFAAASGDNHPIHYDREYCRRHGHADLLAHGFQVVALTAPGAGLLPHLLGDALVAFIEQSSRFLAPVYAGDTVHPALEIVALEPRRTTGVMTLRSTVHKHDGTLAMEGLQKLLVRRRPGAEDPAGRGST